MDRLEDEDYGDFWSVSKLQCIQQCGRKFKYQYIEKIPTVKDATLKFGTAVHRCLELIHINSLWEDGQVQRLWADEWMPYVATIDWENELLSKTVYKNRGQKMLLTYIQSHSDDKIIELEKAFRIAAINGLPKFGGRLDKVVERHGRGAVVDYKTSKYPPDPMILDADPQLTMYYMACKDLGYDVEDFAIHNLSDGVEYWTKRSDSDVEVLLESIRESQEKIKHGMFARNVSFLCKNCSFKDMCLSGLRKTVEELPSTD